MVALEPPAAAEIGRYLTVLARSLPAAELLAAAASEVDTVPGRYC